MPDNLPNSKIKKQEGMVLIMAIMILSLMMASVVFLSRIIIGEVRMSINTGNSISSFYAAESGIEKGLYYIKFVRDFSNLDPFDNLYQYSDSVGNNQNFEIVQASSSRPTFNAYNITTTTPAHVDIIDPSGDISNIDWDPSAAISHDYSVSWGIADCFPTHVSDRLEITVYSFDENVFTDDISNARADVDKKVVLCNCSYASSPDCDSSISSFPIADDRFYRFNFRALDDTIAYLNFDLLADSVSIGIPSEMTVTSQGSYKNSRFKIKAEVPALVPVSDIFSYVIFSEEEILKNL